MVLQDRIDGFQKVVFANFRMHSNNECRIASLVPLVEESYGIYKFITSMLRAMHKRKLKEIILLICYQTTNFFFHDIL